MNYETAELRLTNSRDFLRESISTYRSIQHLRMSLRMSEKGNSHAKEVNILHSLQFIFLCSSLEGFIHSVLDEYYSQLKLIKGLDKSFKKTKSKKILDGIIQLYSIRSLQAKQNSSVLEHLIDGAHKNIANVYTGKKLSDVFTLEILKTYTGVSFDKIPTINNTIQEQRNRLIHGKISYDKLGSTLTKGDLEKLARDILKLCFKSIPTLENNLSTLISSSSA